MVYRDLAPAKLEKDLAGSRFATVRWTDGYGHEQKLTGARLEYFPRMVGYIEGTNQWVAVPLDKVASMDVDDEYTCIKRDSFLESSVERVTVVVAHWRRAPWGDWSRLVPD